MRVGISMAVVLLLCAAVSSPVLALDPASYAGPTQRSHSLAPVAADPAALASLAKIPAASPWKVRWNAATGQPARIDGLTKDSAGSNPEQAAREFLKRFLGSGRSGTGGKDLKTTGTAESLTGKHVRFLQYVGCRPVHGATVSVHMDKTLHVQTVNSNYHPNLSVSESKAGMTSDKAIELARQAARVEGTLRAPAVAESVVYADVQPAVVAWKVVVPARVPLGDFEVLLDPATGKVLSLRNLILHAEAQALVFDPNPVVALKNNKIRDNDDANGAELAGAYTEVTLQGLADPSKPKGQYVDATVGARAEDFASGSLKLDRSQKGFERVMAYYHLDRAQRYFQSLGFSIHKEVQPVDAHGTEDDNSWFSPATGQITYGDGGVDDAEDADVILHEYGHSCQHSVIPGFGGYGEAGAIGEGFGDYLASTMRTDLTFQKDCVASWDGTAYSQDDPPCLRRMDSPKMYPADMQGEVHADGEIWAAVLWQIFNKVGKDVADKIIFESQFTLATNATFADGANAILQADQNLYGGAHAADIKAIFVARGILQ